MPTLISKLQALKKEENKELVFKRINE